MYNAELEGGPRNGVMTALDDFIAEYDRPLRVVVLPIYFGLAIVVEEERLDAQPELAAALDRLESADGRHELLEGRGGRPPAGDGLPAQRLLPARRAARAGDAAVPRRGRRPRCSTSTTSRTRSRIEYLAALRRTSAEARSPRSLRDPVRHDQTAYRRLRAAAARRRRARRRGGGHRFLPYAAMGRHRLDHLERCLDAIRADGDRRRPRRVRHRPRRRRHLHARLPRRARAAATGAVWVADRFRASPEPEPAPTHPPRGRCRVPGRPQPRARRLRALRAARRPRALPAGPARRRRCRTRRSSSSRCCASAAGSAREVRAVLDDALRPARAPAGS